MTKKFYHRPEHYEDLAKARAWYAENNHIGVLRILSDHTGIKRPNLCVVLKGKAGCQPAKLEKIMAAIAAYEENRKKS